MHPVFPVAKHAELVVSKQEGPVSDTWEELHVIRSSRGVVMETLGEVPDVVRASARSVIREVAGRIGQ
jgi:hypothetical protein